MNDKKKGTQPERYGFLGYFLFIVGLAGIAALLLFIFQEQLVKLSVEPSFAWTIWACSFAALLFGLLIMKFWWRLKQAAEQVFYRPAKAGKANSGAKSQVTASSISSEIKTYLRKHYGFFWSRKLRILLLTGSSADVEQLAPGLTAQFWQEDSGTLLLWSGELSVPAGSTRLGDLRKLCRRPFDGVVWVTSALEKSSSLGEQNPHGRLTADMVDSVGQALASRYDLIGWRLPLYVWSLHTIEGIQAERITQSVGCLLPAGCKANELSEQLSRLVPGLVSQGTQQVCSSTSNQFLLQLAHQLSRIPESVEEPLGMLLNPYRPLQLAGVMFSPASVEAKRTVKHHWRKDKRWNVLLDSLASLPSALRPRKLGVSWRQALATAAAAALMLLWCTWMVFSFISNHNLIQDAQDQAALSAQYNQPLADRLHALAALQKTLGRLQYRSEHGVPWYDRAGLSQNDALLNALWPRYRDSAQPLLRDAAAKHLQAQLKAFNTLPPDSPLREQMAKATYDQLKLYLMLARPERMDAAWFSSSLMQAWPQRVGVTTSIWKGVAPSLLTFYGAQLITHPQWRMRADDSMVYQARSLLVRLMGMRNSESTLYQKMLSQVAHLYVDMRLEDMTGDTDAARLFSTETIVPGMFTRQAWEQAVQPAIEKVVKERRDEMDWVLTDSRQKAVQEGSPEELKNRLTERYFADFGGAWLEFLNSLRWNRAETLSDSIDQLTLMADVRQSPLVALMNTLNTQGRTGQTGEAISDSLVKSAKNLLGKDDKDAIDQSASVQGPLDATFGPLLALMDKTRTGSQAQSLQSYLTRVTQVRLRLQQVTNAADPQAMTQTLAQTVFQGKAVDLTETRDYGSLVAAGLGQEWSGFGRTVFVNPMEQAWQQVLAPAADSLNAQWQQAVVSEWNSAFGGRYPFNDASSDVSLPLLAKYLNADSGRIAQFLQTRLNGVLHREGSHWVPDTINAQGLTFNPEFLAAMNTLSHISDVAFTQGNAGMSFELRPGTAEGVMQTDMIIDSQKLKYVNQMPQWKRITWPADTEAPGATLSWISTQAGTRQYADMPGTWGFIRLLDQAAISAYPGVGSSYSLTWKAQDGRSLNYTLHTEAGEGPLALLKLRNFRLPDRIFNVDTTQVQASLTGTNDAETEEVY